MNDGKYTIINLSGNLGSTLGTSLLNQLQSRVPGVKAVILHFDHIAYIEDSGIDFLKKAVFLLMEGRVDFAITGLTAEIRTKLEPHLPFSSIITFLSKEEARFYFEEKAALTSPKEQSVDTGLVEVINATLRDDIYYTSCPSCNAKLRLRSRGNYACPLCKVKFFFNPISKPFNYERISLE